MVGWMFWLTAIVFTILGMIFGVKIRNRLLVEGVIEALIKQGYLKTRGKDVVKYDE